MKLNENIILETYNRLYAISEPSADFNELMKIGKTKQTGFYLHYYLAQSKIDAVISDIAKQFKLSEYDKRRLSKAINLGCAPTSVKKGDLQ